jgi:glutathione S-transferase
MATAKLIGFPQSSYVWTARAGLTLKGVDHTFEALVPGDHKAPAYVARHPFGRVPLLALDGQDVFETSAILRWADRVGSGAPLFPADPVAAALVEQWVSATSCYLYGWIVPGYLFQYPRGGDGVPNRQAIDEVVPKIAAGIAALESRTAGSPWIVDDRLSAADLLVGPLLFVLSRLPEGKQILAANPKVSGLLAALSETEPFMRCAYRG